MTRSSVAILFVESYPHALAGQQETLSALLARAAVRGIIAEVATPGEGIYAEQLRRQGIRVHVHPQPESIARYGGAIYGYRARRSLAMTRQTLGYVRDLRRWLKGSGFRAVFCNDMRGLLTFGLAARLAGLPVIIWDKLDKPHGIYDALQLPLVRRNLVIADHVCAKYPRWQRWFCRGRIRKVADGLELSRYRADEAVRVRVRSELGLAPEAVVAAIIGTISPRKGHDLLLPAFAAAQRMHPELTLLVIGEAPAEIAHFAHQLRRDAGPHVHWLGHRLDIPAVLAAADMLISPSRHEGMGRVNIEAMATGLPVIGALGTGIAEVVVDGETGFLIDPRDSKALCASILELAQDSGLRRRFGAAGLTRAQKCFDAERQLAQVLDELEAIIC